MFAKFRIAAALFVTALTAALVMSVSTGNAGAMGIPVYKKLPGTWTSLPTCSDKQAWGNYYKGVAAMYQAAGDSETASYYSALADSYLIGACAS